MRVAFITTTYLAAISAGGANVMAEGGTTGDGDIVELTLATLNVGGDGPQAEYIGSDWEASYKGVEVNVGAKLVFLANYNAAAGGTCTLGKYKDWYERRYIDAFRDYCDDKKGNAKTEGKKLAETPLKDYVLFWDGERADTKSVDEDWDNVFVPEATMEGFAKYLMGAKEKGFFTWEGVKPLSDLDRSQACKRRAAFPFFGKDFMDLHGKGGIEAKLEFYRGKIDPACSNKGEGSVDYIPLLAYDFFVLREFREFLQGRTEAVKEVEELTDLELREEKQGIVEQVVRDAKPDVFFIQESADILPKATLPAGAEGDAGKGARQFDTPHALGPDISATVAATAVQDKDDKTKSAFDTSILQPPTSYTGMWRNFVKEVEGFDYRKFVKGRQEPAGTSIYGKWLKFVKDAESDNIEQSYVVSNYKKKKDIYNVDATTIITAKIHGLNAMLMSAHPNSDGRPCVLFAYMARRFFQSLDNPFKPELLLVGMDANVLTDADQQLKAPEGTDNGWTWGTFKEKCEYMGYHVIHDPTRDTVHKQRSFLQTQFKKAGKTDRTKKDILLAYSEQYDISTSKVMVLNTLEGNSGGNTGIDFGLGGFGYDGKTPYPTNKWPLDHFLTIAKIKVNKTKEPRWTGQLQEWEDARYAETQAVCKPMRTKEANASAGQTPAKGDNPKPKLAVDIENMMDMAKETDKKFDPTSFNWCQFRGTFGFDASNNDYTVAEGDMKLMVPDIKREDWAAYNSDIFESGSVKTYRGPENAEAWRGWKRKDSERPPAFPVVELPSDHLPVVISLTYKSQAPPITAGTFNVLSVTKSSQSAASFPGFPPEAHALHNGIGPDPEMLDITASSKWIVEQLRDIKGTEGFDFDIMALQEIDYPMYNALVTMDRDPGSNLGFDILLQCGGGEDGEPLLGKRAAQMELLRKGWPRGKANKAPRKDIPAIVWDKSRLTLQACSAVGTISSIGLCSFTRNDRRGEQFNLLAMHGDGDKGFREEEAEIVRQQIPEGVTIHAVVGDLNLHDHEFVLKSMKALRNTMEVPPHQGESVYRYVHPFRKVIQNMQNSMSYPCKDGGVELMCPDNLKKADGFTFGKKAITKANNVNLNEKQPENFYKLCESYIWAGNNSKGVEDFNVLTWNSGGGQPTPEYLGGEWEEEYYGGMFGEIEKLTGALLFEIAGCKVKGFKEGTPFEKYKSRYEKMYTKWDEFKANQDNEAAIKEFHESITPRSLLEGLGEAANRGGTLPEWSKNCEIGFAIGRKTEKEATEGGMGLCDKQHKDTKGTNCLFPVSNEACFPLRDGLPVFGSKFMELLGLDKEEDHAEYWKRYLGSLKNKEEGGEWPEKGCNPVEEGKTPADYMEIQFSRTPQFIRDKIVHETCTYEKWSQVAAWDKLVIRIARFAAEDVLGFQLEDKEKKEKDGQTPMKHIAVMEMGDVTARIQTLVEKAAEYTKAQVIFLQERKNIKDIAGFEKRFSTADTAIFVKTKGFAGIDVPRTRVAEAAWAGIMSAVVERVEQEKSDVVPIAVQLRAPLREEQLKKMKVRGAAPKWALDVEKLATIVVTSNGLLLLSIHADGDGYFCAQYLHLAAKMYDKLESVLRLSGMIVGMDTNVQPGKGHLAHAPDKGFSFDQLKKALPKNMVLIEPEHRTVLKVRTFLQTQFSKIGKKDDVKKDMLFQYGGVVPGRGGKPGKVVNRWKDDKHFIYDDDDTKYYPRDDWPVDHFMVSQKVFVKLRDSKNPMSPDEVDEVAEEIEKAKTELADSAVRDFLFGFCEKKPELALKGAFESRRPFDDGDAIKAYGELCQEKTELAEQGYSEDEIIKWAADNAADTLEKKIKASIENVTCKKYVRKTGEVVAVKFLDGTIVTEGELNQRYRKSSLILHPDKNLQTSSKAAFQEMQANYTSCKKMLEDSVGEQENNKKKEARSTDGNNAADTSNGKWKASIENVKCRKIPGGPLKFLDGTDATIKELRTRYKQSSLILHPDKNLQDKNFPTNTTEKFQEMQANYDSCKDCLEGKKKDCTGESPEQFKSRTARLRSQKTDKPHFVGRAKRAIKAMRTKVRALSPRRRPKVAKTAAASAPTLHSVARKIKHYINRLSSKAKHMLSVDEAHRA